MDKKITAIAATALLGFSLQMAGTNIANAAPCGNNQSGFKAWQKAYKKEAAAAGFSKATLSVLDGLTYNKTVIRLDRNQAHPKGTTFESYAAKRLTKSRISKGKGLLKKHAKLLSSIEKRYGVPGPVVVAIWGLETDFGANQGNMSSFRSLATLAYDCRRTDFFTNELNAALSIVQRGYMQASRMKGAWAGELGQTQFLASSYLKYAVDSDK
ncbi:MAG: lytic murein transglycosylase, partial [Rhizobiaceae bacterium]|nr:lytic murein transglycosylase [Rhizobiaceae bacterium]